MIHAAKGRYFKEVFFLPEGMKPIENPRLLTYIEDFKQNQNNENWNKVLGEIVMNAKFLMPARLDGADAPIDSDLAEMQAGSRLQFYMITSTDGKPFFLAFTDIEELKKWNLPEDGANRQIVVMTFDDYASLIMKDEKPAGFVINPYKENLALDRKMVEQLRERKEILLKGHAENVVGKDTPVKLGEPDPYPTEMIADIRGHLGKEKAVEAAYLRHMIRDDMESYLIVVDFQGDKDAVFGGIAGAARPHLEGKYLDLVGADSAFGKQAIEGVEPFYKRKKFGLF